MKTIVPRGDAIKMFSVSVLNKLVKSRNYQQIVRYAKFGPKNRDEREAAVEAERFKTIRNSVLSVLKKRQFLSAPEWKTLQLELQKKDPLFKNAFALNQKLFRVILSLRPPHDSMQNAKALIEAFELKKDLSLNRIFIELYAKKASEQKLSTEEEQELIKLCNEFIAQEMHALPEINSIVIVGLCATSEWKKALNLQNTSSNSLNILIRKALRENEVDLAFSLLKKLTEFPKQYQYFAYKTFSSFVKTLERHPKTLPDYVEKLIQTCSTLEMVLVEENAKELTNLLRKSGHHAEITTINFSGICGACKTSLKPVQLTNKQFELVKNEFMTKVVKGDDIYRKTTPEEWRTFERVIKENGPFDIVMDGLNVSYATNTEIFRDEAPRKHKSVSTQQKSRPSVDRLAKVVWQLAEEGKRILVIGRKHMSRWPKMDIIARNATIFLVDNVSKDDVFMLYATLHSGQNSYILSNDFMRQHKFAIGRQFDKYFKLWQQDHWYGYIPGNGKTIEMFKPMQYKMFCHKVDDYWHLPFKSHEEVESNTWSYYQLPKNWACVRLKKE